MKILILSDSHLHDEIILDIYNHTLPDEVLCLGDLGNKLNEQFKDYIIVKGNNDFEDFPKELIHEYDGHKAFMCHGHYYDVERGIDQLVKKAKELGCDTVLYGHTHQPLDVIKDGIHVINPGSIKFPRNGKILIPTYCVYENGEYRFYNAKTFEYEEHLFDPVKKKKEKVKEPKVRDSASENSEPKQSLFAKLIAFFKSLFGK